MNPIYDLIIVGAGPTGLATAIEAQRHHLNYAVIEKGCITNSIFHFPNQMVFFTTPELLEIGGMPLVSEREKPTRNEALKYYRKVASALHLNVHQYEEVQRIQKLAFNAGPTVRPTGGTPAEPASLIRPSDGPPTSFNAGPTVRPAGGTPAEPASLIRPSDGPPTSRHFRVVTSRTEYETRNVVIAIGYYDNPNLLGIPGEDLPHVSHYYTEPYAFYNRDVVVVGGKNSAAEAALDLFRGGARVTLVHRGSEMGSTVKYWVRPDIENRFKVREIAAFFNARVVEINAASVQILQAETIRSIPAQQVFLLTGYHSSTTLFQQLGVRFDPNTLRPEFDPQTFETNVPGVYLAGSVVGGRQNAEVFIENGRFHGELVVRTIADQVS